MNRTTNNLARAAAVGLLAGVALGVGATAWADTDVRVSRLAVDYRDLDLTSDAGLAVLYERLVAAARNVCPREPGGPSLKQRIEVRRCRDAAIGGAIAQIGNQRLAAVHAEQQRRG